LSRQRIAYHERKHHDNRYATHDTTPSVISDQATGFPGLSLPRHCSIRAGSGVVDTVIARSSRAAIGKFRCPADHPSFRDSGAISECLVVFPRTSVWIRHEGSRRFLADPNVVTIYNRAQRYERFRHSADGDACDWFGVADDIAREIAASFDASVMSADRPFGFEWTLSTAPLYLRQRALLRRVERGDIDLMAIEEEVFAIVATTLSLAYRQRPRALDPRARASRRRRDLVDAARAELVSAPHLNHSVHTLAGRLGTSPFHLCRVFRAYTGTTMHEYRAECRVRLALERLESTATARANLSRVAHDLGFASHSHFVKATRRYLGMTPSGVRQLMKDGE
jgi:AraC-like DNA-binding protein